MENNNKPQELSCNPSEIDSINKSIKHRKKHRYLWTWIYGFALTAYTVYTMLDVFVIPHDTVKMNQSAMAEVYQNTAGYGQILSEENGTSDSSLNFAEDNTSNNISESTDTAAGVSLTDPTVSATENGYIYEDGSTTITLSRQYVNDTMIYVADIQLSSIATLKSGLANDSFGRNVKEKTSDIAERVDAILAVNGDYYGFRDSGYVIRNGILYRSESSSAEAQDLVIYTDGSMEIIREGDISAEELLERGALQVYSFGPGLVENGEITVTENSEVGHSMSSNPRTAIGCITPLHYVMVVSDGRTSESAGLSLLQLASILKELGCETAYNLDGGGSTTMYFNGEIINNPTTNGHKESERKVSDIVYIGY